MARSYSQSTKAITVAFSEIAPASPSRNNLILSNVGADIYIGVGPTAPAAYTDGIKVANGTRLDFLGNAPTDKVWAATAASVSVCVVLGE